MTHAELDQPELERVLRARLAAGDISGTTVAELEARLLERAADPQRLQAVVVVERFAPAPFVRGTLRFVRSLNDAERAAWHRELTRTVFLLGSPKRLKERFAFAHVSEDGGLGWVAPKPAQEQLTLTRLLKPLRTASPGQGWVDMVVRGATPSPSPRELKLVTAGVRLEEILVHLNHLLADALVEGQLNAEETLQLRPVAKLCSGARGALLRVGRALGDQAGLAAFAALESTSARSKHESPAQNVASEA